MTHPSVFSVEPDPRTESLIADIRRMHFTRFTPEFQPIPAGAHESIAVPIEYGAHSAYWRFR